MNAKKETFGKTEAMKVVSGVNQLYAAKGKKIVHFDLKKDKPDDESIEKMILGPTGNLRAPTMRKGNILIVGFNQEMYEETLG